MKINFVVGKAGRNYMGGTVTHWRIKISGQQSLPVW